jgi:hypothetical protein
MEVRIRLSQVADGILRKSKALSVTMKETDISDCRKDGGLKAEILNLFQISTFCYPSSMESLLNRNSLDRI